MTGLGEGEWRWGMQGGESFHIFSFLNVASMVRYQRLIVVF